MKLKNKLIIFFLLTIFCVSFVFIKIINPTIDSISIMASQSIATECTNKAIAQVLSDDISYNDFFNVNIDSDGNITFIESKFISLNLLIQSLINVTYNILVDESSVAIKIPLGNFTGIVALTGRGPDIELYLSPIINVKAEFVSIFESVGFNMTKHTIYINLYSILSISLPIKYVEVDTTNQIMFCENIIAGSIPDTYLNSTGLENSLNLLTL